MASIPCSRLKPPASPRLNHWRLSASASVLRQHREVNTKSTDGELSPWVFPATDNSMPVCVKSFGKQLADRQRTPEQRLSNRTKAVTSLTMPGGRWTAHDLRRTAATLMARCDFGSDTINECLGHRAWAGTRSTCALPDAGEQPVEEITGLALPEHPGLAEFRLRPFAKLELGHRNRPVLAVALGRLVTGESAPEDIESFPDDG